MDPVNALLSLFYTVLASDCAGALRAAGLDPYVGVMHVLRPGRRSLALDLMEELRAVMVDRFVLSAINTRAVRAEHFEIRQTGEVRLTDGGRSVMFNRWHDRNHEVITHPYLEEKMPWGLVPQIQAKLLAKTIRGELDAYPAFLWK